MTGYRNWSKGLASAFLALCLSVQVGYLPVHVLVSPHHDDIAMFHGIHDHHHGDNQEEQSEPSPTEEDQNHSSLQHSCLTPSVTHVALSDCATLEEIFVPQCDDKCASYPPSERTQFINKSAYTYSSTSPRAPPLG